MIELQFATQRGLVSSVIRTWTRSPFSHVDVVWGNDLIGARSDKTDVDHAGLYIIDPGVQIRPDGYAPFTATLRVRLKTTRHEACLFHDFVFAQLGKPYDKIAIMGLALDRDWRSPNQWFCSELAMAALEEAGIVPRLNYPTNFISPRDVLMIALTQRGAAIHPSNLKAAA